MKKVVLFVTICLLLGIALAYFPYFISQNRSLHNNGFTRLFPPHVLNDPRTFDLKFNSYYIAGYSRSHLFLANVVAPTYILSIDKDLKDTIAYRAQIPRNNRCVTTALQVTVDSPDVYMAEGISPAILRGKLPELHMAFNNVHNINYFSSSVALPNSTFVLKTYDTIKRNSLFTRLMLDSPYANSFPNILEKQLDGFFCTDGMLKLDAEYRKLVYIYFYRNEFIVMDTALNILYKARTIDTTSTVKIKVSSYGSDKFNTTTFSEPPVYVNKEGCASGDWLFINSALCANNEDRDVFNSSSVIDVYSLKDGSYKFSFYLPDYEHKKMSSFRVIDNSLYLIQNHYIVKYRLKM